jgi:hypothetical protein
MDISLVDSEAANWLMTFEANVIAGSLDGGRAQAGSSPGASTDDLEHAKYPEQLIRQRKHDEDLLKPFVGNEYRNHSKRREQSLPDNVLHAKRV